MRHIYTSNHTNASMWTNSWKQKRNNVKMQHANVFINFWKWRYEAGSAHYNSDVTGSCWWSYHQYLHSLPETSVQYSRGGSQTPREETAFKKWSELDWSTWIRLFQHPDLWQKYGSLFSPQDLTSVYFLPQNSEFISCNSDVLSIYLTILTFWLFIFYCFFFEFSLDSQFWLFPHNSEFVSRSLYFFPSEFWVCELTSSPRFDKKNMGSLQ